MSNTTVNLKQLNKVHRAWLIGAAALLILFWGIGLREACLYSLKKGEVELVNKTRQFDISLMDAAIRQRELMGNLLPEFMANQLDEKELSRQSRDLTDWFMVTLVRDPKQPPVSIPRQLFGNKEERQITRSLRTPQGELRTFTVLRRGDGAALVFEAKRSELLGHYLKERFERLAFGQNASYRLLTSTEAQGWLQENNPSRLKPTDFYPFRNLGDRWEFLVNPRFLMAMPPRMPHGHDGPPPPGFEPRGEGFPGHHPGPPPIEGGGHPSLLVVVPKWPLLAGVFRNFALIFLAGGVLVGLLALSLRTVQRGIQHELELARAKSNFTAMVSHELKTPVTAIRMYAEMLQEGLVTDAASHQSFIDTIASEAIRLQSLIENLLELGRVESGTRRFLLAPEPLRTLLEEAVSRAQRAFNGDEKIKLIPPNPALQVLVDREAAIQAVVNLAHNALKYGGSEVEIEAIPAKEKVVIEVRDRGPGIPLKHREAIFSPYVRLENEETRTSQGTGLGLALVKAYATALRGAVSITDRPGGGSVFRLTLEIPQGEPHECQATDRRG